MRAKMTDGSRYALAEDDPARKSREQAHYDRRAGDLDDPRYDWTSGSARMIPALRGPYQYLESLLASRCSGKHVLDFGCGHGIFSIHPARYGATVIGVDISPRSLARARQRAVLEKVTTRARFCVGDCERLPFPDRSFDVVVSCGMLSCLNLRQGINEVARVLKRDGHAFIVDTLGHNPLINLRRLWASRRGHRTEWTTQHILQLSDLQVFEQHFERCNVRPFDLTILGLASVPSPATWLLDAASRVDRWLLERSALTKFAFKVVVEASGPRT
jgi:SAM-dependent methyltransferase